MQLHDRRGSDHAALRMAGKDDSPWWIDILFLLRVPSDGPVDSADQLRNRPLAVTRRSQRVSIPWPETGHIPDNRDVATQRRVPGCQQTDGKQGEEATY